MKKFFTTASLSFILTFLFAYSAFAQKSTGINNLTPSSNAALDVSESTSFPQGILIPRLPASDSTTIKGRITANDKGLMFFDTNNNVFQYWNGTKWVSFGGANTGSNQWTQSGANIYYNTGNVGIGTSSTTGTLNIVVGAGNEILFPSTGSNIQIFATGTPGQFQIGKGSSFEIYTGNNSLPAIHANSSNKVGVGIANATYKFQVIGQANADTVSANSKFRLGTSATAGQVLTTDANGYGTWQAASSGWGILGNTGTTASTNFIGTIDDRSFCVRTKNIKRMLIDSLGNVGIGMNPSGTYILEINGSLKSAGITETSDLRWKKDVKTLENTLQNVTKLRGVTYNWRKNEFPEKNFDNKEQIGLIAQEVEKIYPQLVDTDALGFKSVQYSKVVALLIEALKEQQSEIASLKAEVSKMTQLENKVNSLTALVEILAKQNPVVETRK